jgi:hypothetical protein
MSSTFSIPTRRQFAQFCQDQETIRFFEQLGSSNGETIGNKGDITVNPDGTWTINVGAVTNGKMSPVPSPSFKGRVDPLAGIVEDMTPAQATSILDTFTSTTQGVVPASGFSPTDVLYANGSFAPLSSGSIQNVAPLTVLANVTNVTADVQEVSTSQVLDMVGGTAQGTMLYRGASGWTTLPPGISGQLLQTNGVDNNPSWSSAWSIVTKTSTEFRFNTTTLTQDSMLFANLVVGSYTIRGWFAYQVGDASMGFNFDLNFSGAATYNWAYRNYIAPGSSSSNANEYTIMNNSGISVTSIPSGTIGVGKVSFELSFNASSSGVFSVRWCQSSATSNVLSVLRGSYMEYIAT